MKRHEIGVVVVVLLLVVGAICWRVSANASAPEPIELTKAEALALTNAQWKFNLARAEFEQALRSVARAHGLDADVAFGPKGTHRLDLEHGQILETAP